MANAVGGAPYFEDAAAGPHETEETDLYPHPHNVPIPVSEQSLKLKSLKRQVDYSNHDYEGYDYEHDRRGAAVSRDHADSYDRGYDEGEAYDDYPEDEQDRFEERRPRVRSYGRRQRAARHLDDYDEEPYEDDRSMGRGGKRMYDGRMPPFKVRAGRLTQMDGEPEV